MSTVRSAGSRTVLLHRPGPGAEAADSAQQRLTCCSTASRGSAGPRRSTTRSPRRCATAASRCSTSPTCSTEALAIEAGPQGDSPRRCSPTSALGDTLRAIVASPSRRPRTRRTSPAALIAGIAHEELQTGRGLVYRLMDRHDFVIDPLPNLLFTRDSRLDRRPGRGDQPGDAGAAPRDVADRGDLPPPPAVRRRRRCSTSPGRSTSRAATCCCSRPGVVAVGVGERTTPAGAERLARGVFDDGLAHTCWPCRSRRSAPRCTSTPCARWSTSTRW